MQLKEQPDAEHVVLVDDLGCLQGAHDKQDAHLRGLLHRAFSVLLVNDRGEVLLQKRSDEKYHCAGLWSNTCCGHPRLNEAVEAAALRRLDEELGMGASLTLFSEFRYRLPMPNGLIENEFVSFFLGRANDEARPNPLEVSAVEWRSFDELCTSITSEPSTFTPWFGLYMEKFAPDIARSIHEELL